MNPHQRETAERCLRAGAMGYVMKGEPSTLFHPFLRRGESLALHEVGLQQLQSLAPFLQRLVRLAQLRHALLREAHLGLGERGRERAEALGEDLAAQVVDIVAGRQADFKTLLTGLK